MNETQEFSFGDFSVATSYDSVLVPILFEPWAKRLAEEHQPWEGNRVLDLATGTGIVAQTLAHRVGSQGKVTGIDINAEMLKVARRRCKNLGSILEFVECPAGKLNIPDNSADVVVCQQGFQFFPNRMAAACEIYRVLSRGGKLVATTWRPVSECQFFGAICDALIAMDEPDLADMMRVPFDVLAEADIVSDLESAGFQDVQVSRQYQDLIIEGGIERAVNVAYSTPIGPKLRSLPTELQERFRGLLRNGLDDLSTDGESMGRMVTNVFVARKVNQTNCGLPEAVGATRCSQIDDKAGPVARPSRGFRLTTIAVPKKMIAALIKVDQ